MRDPKIEISKRSARRFLRLFWVVFILGVGALSAFVIWANVWGNYGDRGMFMLYNDREGKVRALKEKPREQLPEAYIFGASTTYPLLPRTVEQHTGLSTYSLSNFWSRMNEHWAWLNFIEKDLASEPRMIILGLNTWTFRPDNRGPHLYPHLRRRLINSPDLFKQLDEYNPVQAFLSKALDVLSSQQLNLAWQKFKRNRPFHDMVPALGDVGVIDSRFHADGTGPYREEEADKVFASDAVNDYYRELLYEGRDPDSAESLALRERFIASQEHITKAEVARFFIGKGFSARSVNLFERFVERCEERNIPLGIIYIPIHPLFDEKLNAHTDHQLNRRNMDALVKRVTKGRNNKIVVFDATDLRSFDGDPGRFHDAYHMKPSTGDQLLAAFFERWDK